MATRDSGTHQLQEEVYKDPFDPFLRCNLACVLASLGDYQSAMRHLGIAMEHANGAMAAGCVSAAIREITDDFARLWQLPEPEQHLALVSA
jgi:thioredoxin-like negative regulator of GroEL